MKIKMKSNKHYIRSLLTLFLFMCSTISFADDFWVRNSYGKNIYYNYNSDGSSVSVTYLGTDPYSYSREYTRTVVIPETVTYGGKTYSVTSIGPSAFYGCSTLTSVTIPNSVTSIGGSAFHGCSGLTSVTIPNSVTSIGSYAFEGCSGLTSVTIPNSVTRIEDGAFYKCSGLTSVTIPNSVTSIGSYAFSNCWNLTSVTIPNNVTSIGEYAFRGCSGLTSVTIGNSVTSIDSSAFSHCSGLTSVTWNAKNYPAFSSALSSPFYDIRTQITEFIMGDEVTSIPAYMCYGMSNLKSINIPDGVTSIGSEAFYGCSGLQKVIVPNIDIKKWCSITFGSSSANPLYYAHHLYSDENTEITKLVIPNDVTRINSYAFYGCSDLTSVTIGNSVTSIGSYAFSGCSGLTSVTIPNSVTSIGSEAFYNTSIKSLTIGTDIQTMGSNALRGIDKVIWLSNTPPSGYTNAGGTVNYVPNDSYSGLSNTKIYPFLSSMFEVDGIKYVPVSPSERTCDAIDCIYNESAENTKIGNTATYKNITMTVKNVGNSICYGNTYIKTLEYTFDGTISSSAFSGCSGLTSVTIGNSVTSIGSYAFQGCSGLKSVTIPNSVTSIGSYAFNGCSGLQKVIVPNIDLKNWCSITFGSSSANPLYYAHHLYSDENTEITKLVIPNDVTSINSYAFYGCSGLTLVTIPNSVTNIGSSAFNGCSGLQKVIVPNIDIKNWCNIKFASSTDNPLSFAHHLYSDENTEITKLVIPNDVTSINSYAFSGCSGLTSVTIGNSVTSIGSSAFSGCSGLTSVTWNAKNYPAFSSYSSNPFYNIRTQITEFIMEDEVTSIPAYMCYGMNKLKAVTIGNSVTSIGSSAFSGCSGLTSVTWNAKNYPAFSSYSSSPFYDIRTQITKFLIGDEVISIPKYMCYGMSNLKSVTIGNSVTSIGSSAFNGCSGLQKVIVPNIDIKNWCNIKFASSTDNPLSFAHHLYSDENTEITKLVIPNDVTSINSYAFYGCSNFESVDIPNSVTNIGSSAFSGCSGLTSVTIPNSVTTISSSAFSGCSGLTSVTIPNSVTTISSSAFSGCSGLKKVIVPDIKNWCSIKFDDSSANPLAYAHHLYSNENTEITELVIPNGVTSIGSYAFRDCSGLTSVTIPNSVTTISSSAFQGCSGLTLITIPNSVTSIGSSAFMNCSGLTSVTIPNSVTSIGSGAFKGCNGLEKVIVPNIDIKNWCSIKFASYTDNPLYYARHLYSDENTEITKLVIPDGVTSIPNYVFSGCSGLTSVTISNSVTSIGSSAFSGCSGLTSVTIPNSVTSIGSSAFSGCSGLKSITWNAKNYPAFSSYSSSPFYNIRTQITKFIIGDEVTSIEAYMCYEMSNLESVTIPNSVTSIGASAFSGCSGLTSVRFENSKDNTPIVLENNKVFSDCPLDEVYIGRKLSYTKTSSAGYSPFYRNTTLRSVKFTDKESEISDYEFYGCTNLTDVSMGDGVKSIGAYAFSGCSSLEHFTCGRQLESIGKEAFSDCTSMTKFRTRAAVPPTCGAQALDDINKWECTLYVPTESIDDYQAADQWKNFFFIEKFNLQGDSNGDDVVNAKDYSGVASYIMGDSPEAFDVEASDVDENGTVDVRDYVGIANIISAGSIYGGTSNNAKAAMSKGSAMPATDDSDTENVIYVENVSGSKNSQVELSVRMRNASDIRGFQFDLYLPEGVTIANNAKASLSSDRLAAGDAHTLMADEMTDGAVRFLCSSMNDESFTGGNGEVATLTVNIADNVANGDYDIVVKNAIMTETDISRSYEADNIKSTLTVLDQTGVETVTADNERCEGPIYTVGGQLVGKKSTTSQLRKGIYIRNGKKFVVK